MELQFSLQFSRCFSGDARLGDRPVRRGRTSLCHPAALEQSPLSGTHRREHRSHWETGDPCDSRVVAGDLPTNVL